MQTRVIIVAVASVLAAACGGGGGTVAGGVTPLPPAPAPPATNESLDNLIASQSFTNDAVTSAVTIDLGNGLTIASSNSAAPLTIQYDATSRSYTISTGGRTETFGPDHKAISDVPGSVGFEKSSGNLRQFLTLADLSFAQNRTRYVSAGYWERNQLSSEGVGITFDAFTYGIPTVNSAMPRSGRAGYGINLFGFFAPLNLSPRAVSGEGVMTVDFLRSLFSMEGTAYEVDLLEDYYTGQHRWVAGGQLSSVENAFQGRFNYAGRERFSVAGQVQGRFYGPGAGELGATFSAEDISGTMLTGTILGRQDLGVTTAPLTLLDNQARMFFTNHAYVLYFRDNGSIAVEGAALQFPNSFGRLNFNEDGSVQLDQISSMTYPKPIFLASDKVAEESNAQVSTYRSTQPDGQYRLILNNPGSSNADVALTYANFGRWDWRATDGDGERVSNIWFTYGIPPAQGTLPREGTAEYAMTIRGSGVMFATGSEYTLSGDASLNVDFAQMRVSGGINPIATASVPAPPVELSPVTFAGDLSDGYGFSSWLSERPGYADGSVTGGLYGPHGEEAIASFEMFKRTNGVAEGNFAGVMIGKRK